MKKHIELVKKFLDDDTSVSLEELRANSNDAFDSWAATDYKCDVEYASFRASRSAFWASRSAFWAYRAAYWAYWVVAADNLENAERYRAKAIEAIAEYEELTK